MLDDLRAALRRSDELIAERAAEDLRISEVLAAEGVQMVTEDELSAMTHQQLVRVIDSLRAFLTGVYFAASGRDSERARLLAERVLRQMVELVKTGGGIRG